ncbi:hypothetical protein OROGR_022698 [Orobanche gracilis]
MLKFLKGVVGGSGAGLKDLPYNIGEPYSTAWGSWLHHRGTSKDDGTPVSVFTLSGSNANDGHLVAGRNGVKRLRTVRHPNILSFLHSTEAETLEGSNAKVTIYIVTEPVMPLSEKIKELELKGSQRYHLPPEEMKKFATMMNRFQELAQAKRAAPELGPPLTSPTEEGPLPPPPTDLPLPATAETEPGAELVVGGSSRGTFLEGVAAHVRRATEDLPRAWNAELEEVAGRRSLETAQAALTHALRTSVLMAKVVNDLEVGPNVAQLQMQLDRAVKRLGNSQAKLAATEKQTKKLDADCQKAITTINQLKVYLEHVLNTVEENRKVIAARDAEVAELKGNLKAKTGEAAESKAELARRTEELDIKKAALTTAAADLEAAQNEIIALKAQLKEADRSPSPDAALVGEFSYFMAFADSIRVSSKAGIEVGPLVELLKGYATENPMHPDYPLPILDLQTVHGIDLSWYPRPDQLVLPPSGETATAGGEAAEGSKATESRDAAGGDGAAV